MTQQIMLRFLGHSAWQVRYNEFDILIDPFITGNPKAAVEASELTPTHIILSHGHGDHFGDTVELATRSGAQVIAGHEIAEYLGEKKVDAHGMAVGGARNFPFGRVKLTLAHHSSSLPDGTYGGTAAGILLTLGEKTIYHAGDTALFLDMQLIGESGIDLALLPIGDNYTMGIDDAVRAVELLKPHRVIPMHYNTFPVIEVDPEEFRAKLEAKGYPATILHPGESFQL